MSSNRTESDEPLESHESASPESSAGERPDIEVDVDAGPLLTYQFVLSLNHGNETLISEERNNDHFNEIGLAKPGDWDDENWLCGPVDVGSEPDIEDGGEEGESEKGSEEEQEEGDDETAATGTDETTSALDDPDIEATSPLPAYLRLQWGPTAEHQALFSCNLPTLVPEAFKAEHHRLGPGLEDEHPYDISIYARSQDHGDEIILDDNGISLLAVFIEWNGGASSRYGERTRAYAKCTVSDEVPELSSGEIGRMLRPWRMLLRNATTEEG